MAQYDLVITNGIVVDGTGLPRRRADAAVKDGRIAAIGFVDASEGDRVIDAAGRVVAVAERLGEVDGAGLVVAVEVTSGDHAGSNAAVDLGLVVGGVVAGIGRRLVGRDRRVGGAAGVAVVDARCGACGGGFGRGIAGLGSGCASPPGLSGSGQAHQTSA